jgi:predicted transcriptional regulator
MLLELKTTPEIYFKQILEILSIMPPFKSLRPRQREVLAEILYYTHKFNKENPVTAGRLLSDYKTKEEISEKLNISKANLYNIYKELRQTGLLIKDEINPKYRYEYMYIPEITFRFKEKDSV